jgi:transcriptional regulator with XRE-family HTH domain
MMPKTILEFWTEPMTNQTTFLKNMGERISRLRKEYGMTQSQLGKAVGVTQQVIAEYESGCRNIPVCRLVSLAEALGVTVEKLIKDSGAGERKRGPASRIEQLVNQVSKLPKTRQRFVVEMLEDAVSRAQ